MGPPRSSKKRPQANRAHRRVKEILGWDKAYREGCRVRCAQRMTLEREPHPLKTADATAPKKLNGFCCLFLRLFLA
jgi:hypothetical protein